MLHREQIRQGMASLEYREARGVIEPEIGPIQLGPSAARS